MAKFGIGQAVRRLEDVRLVQGRGTYTDDLAFAGMAHAVLVRSPYAHARVKAVDTAQAKAAPGVLAVFTGADCDAAGIGDIPCVARFANADGSPIFVPPRRPLAVERVRFVGDPVAMIVAESVNAAKDAADLVEIDYEELPAIADTAGAAAPDAPLLYEEHGSNVVFDWEIGDRAAAEDAFSRAARVVELDLVNQRVVVCAMEPRAAIGAFDAAEGRYTLYAPSQGVAGLRENLARLVLKIPREKLRIVTNEVGGGFGMKTFLFPEHPLVLFAARELGRPVKWTAERAESFLCDTQGRDNVTRAALALDDKGGFLGVKIETIANLGAYLSQYGPFIPTFAAGAMQTGLYRIPAIHQRVRGVVTNTPTVDAYRGAGRPEASYVIERLVDLAAREIGLGADELRRRNFIAPEDMPYKAPYGTIDSGAFAELMDEAFDAADREGFAARRAARKSQGLLSGLGLAYYVERTVAGEEFAKVLVRPDGKVRVDVGTQSNGQGHETAFAQIVAERLGIDIEAVEVASGDTDRLGRGGGTGGSRSGLMGGGAAGAASEAVLDKGTALAARALQREAGEISYADGAYHGGGASISLFEVARIAAEEGAEGLLAEANFKGATNTFPNGAHICEVTIDPETGETRIARYTAVDDFGRVMNPLIVKGQVHGGVVQGLGQAMGEEAVFDEGGQLLTGSFMDYWLPRAEDMPDIEVRLHEVPCTTNPLGIKGCGEAGTVAACGAYVNAVLDALAPLGIKRIDMPVTAEKVWRAIAAARAGAPAGA